MEKDTSAKTREKIVKGSVGTDKAVFTAHICSKGRLVIPKEVRDTLSIEEGCLLRCKIRKVAGALQKGSN